MFGNNLFRQLQMGGLLGQPNSQMGGLLGGNTQNLMQQYLQNLFMRRYQPPAIQQQPGMVSSQMGQGGMQYRAPQIANTPLPGARSGSLPTGSTPYPQGGGYWLNNIGFFTDGTMDPNNGNWSS
jgi:hypothetical protein